MEGAEPGDLLARHDPRSGRRRSRGPAGPASSRGSASSPDEFTEPWLRSLRHGTGRHRSALQRPRHPAAVPLSRPGVLGVAPATDEMLVTMSRPARLPTAGTWTTGTCGPGRRCTSRTRPGSGRQLLDRRRPRRAGGRGGLRKRHRGPDAPRGHVGGAAESARNHRTRIRDWTTTTPSPDSTPTSTKRRRRRPAT